MPVKYKLDNGLTVLLVESHKSPVISAQLWVKTGSVNELKGEEGLSHFIEHLVFKGSDQYKMGEISQKVESNGGELNAYTSFDQTVFYINISSQFKTVALDCLSQMMGFPTFDAQEIDNEREVVIEEIKRSNDSASRRSSQNFFQNVMKGTPYAIPVIGYEKIIKSVSRKKILNYFNSYYVPQNMILVVAGDFDSSIKAEIKKYFSTFKKRKARAPLKLSQKKAQAGVKVIESEFKENIFHVTWRIPGVAHKDLAALDVLSMILGQGDSSRLVKRLRLENPLTQSIGSYTYAPKHLGVFDISFSGKLEDVDQVLAELKDEVSKLITDTVTEEELKRAKFQTESDTIYGMETVEGLARRYGTVEFYFNDHKKYWDYLNDVMALTPEGLRKIAKKYLDFKNVYLSAMVSEDAKGIDKKLKAFAANMKKTTLKAKPLSPASKKKVAHKVKAPKSAPSVQSKLETIQLDNGGKLYFIYDSSAPVFSLKAAFIGGVRAEKKRGAQEMLSRVITSQTKKRNEEQIQAFIEDRAASLSAYSGRNTFGFSAYGLSKNFEELGSLMGEVMLEHEVNSDILEREKSVLIEGLKQRADKPGYIVSQQFNKAFFGDHPYSLDLQGEPQDVQALTSKDLEEYWNTISYGSNASYVCVGQVDKKKVVSLLNSIQQGLRKGKYAEPAFSLRYPKNEEKLFTKLDKEQSHIMVGFPGLKITDENRFNMQVMQAILAGQGGRLFLELRDKASLAYSVSPMNFEGIEGGYFGAYIACSPEKGQKAIAMMNEELKKLANEPVPQSEIDRAKRYLIGRHDLDLQKVSAIATSVLFQEVYGLSSNETFQYAKMLDSVTAESIQKLAKNLFSQKSVTSAVGKTQPF